MVVGSPTTDLLESVDCLLRDCERYFPNTDGNMAQNLMAAILTGKQSVKNLYCLYGDPMSNNYSPLCFSFYVPVHVNN